MKRTKKCYGCSELAKPCDTEKVWKFEVDCPRGRHTKPSAQPPTSKRSILAARSRSTQQPPITDLLAVTSLSLLPHHLDKQARCLDSWRLFGLSIASVNTPEEISQLCERYPQVSRWVPCEARPTEYDRQTQSINALASVATTTGRTVMLINSDIEIHGKQGQLLDRRDPSALVAGIRHNHTDDVSPARREQFGLDAFALSPEMVATLPAIPFSIGKPGWDYWIPLHFCRLGYRMEFIGEPLFFHASHAIHWSAAEWAIGAAWLEEHYGERIGYGDRTFRASLPFPPA